MSSAPPFPLSSKEKEQIRVLVHAAVNGPYLDDDEFQTVVGVTRDEARAVLARWPDLNFENDDLRYVVNGALNNLTGYPHRQDALLVDETGQNLDEIAALYKRFRKSMGWNDGSDYWEREQ